MPRRERTPGDRLGPRLGFDVEAFDAHTVQRLVAATRLCPTQFEDGGVSVDDVVQTLNAVTALWCTRVTAERAPTPAMTDASIKRVAKAFELIRQRLPLVSEPCVWDENAPPDRRLEPAFLARLRRHVEPALLERYCNVFLPGKPDPDALLNALAEAAHALAGVVEAAARDRSEHDAGETVAVLQSPPGGANAGLVVELAKVYSALFDRPVRLSRNAATGKLTGPLMRFLKSALATIDAASADSGIALSDETVAGHLGAILGHRFAVQDVILQPAEDPDDDDVIAAGYSHQWDLGNG